MSRGIGGLYSTSTILLGMFFVAAGCAGTDSPAGDAPALAPTAVHASLTASDPSTCMRDGQAACVFRTCALSPWLQGLPIPDDAPANTRSGLVLQATAACTAATAGDIAAAIAALDQVVVLLGAAHQANAVDAFQFDEISTRVAAARAALSAIPTVSVTGTWMGVLPLTGTSGVLVVQLHQRADGTLLGYVPGGAGVRAIASGSIGLDRIRLAVELPGPNSVRTITVDGVVQVDATPQKVPTAFTGTAGDGTTQAPITWTFLTGDRTERRLVFVASDHDNARMDVSLVVNAAGGLLSGAFHATDCALFACDGEVFGMSEDADDRLRLMLEAPGGVSGWLDATFVAMEGDSTAYVYQGVVHRETPVLEAAAVDVHGYRARGTTTAHAALTLATFARLADDLAGRADFLSFLQPPSYPVFSPSYLHDGKIADDRLLEFATQENLYNPIVAEFSRFRNLATLAILEPDRIHPLGRGAVAVDFDDRRTGTANGETSVYRDVASLPPFDDLRFLEVATVGESPVVRVLGNQSGGTWLDLPFSDRDLPTVSNFLPFGVWQAERQRRSLGFVFGFPSGQPGDTPPTVLAMGASQLVFAMGDGPGSACATGMPTRLVTMANGYRVEYESVVGCAAAVASPSIPARTVLGQPSGSGTPPEYGLTVTARATDSEPVCPYWLLSEEARSQAFQVRNGSPYPGELTAPLLCNDLPAGPLPFPETLTWERDPGVSPDPNAPAQIRFTRTGPGTGGIVPYDYDFLDASGAVFRHGPVTAQTPPASPGGDWALVLGAASGPPVETTYRVQVTSPTMAAMDFSLTPTIPGSQVRYWTKQPWGTTVGPACWYNQALCHTDPCSLSGQCDWTFSCLPLVCPTPASGCLTTVCTAEDACNPVPKDCDDGNLCTQDICVPPSGECSHPPVPCDDSDPCTVDSCDPATGGCQHEAHPCSPIACMLSSCDGNGGCIVQPRVCMPTGDYCKLNSCNSDTNTCETNDRPDGTTCPPTLLQADFCGPSTPFECLLGQCTPDCPEWMATAVEPFDLHPDDPQNPGVSLNPFPMTGQEAHPFIAKGKIGFAFKDMDGKGRLAVFENAGPAPGTDYIISLEQMAGATGSASHELPREDYQTTLLDLDASGMADGKILVAEGYGGDSQERNTLECGDTHTTEYPSLKFRSFSFEDDGIALKEDSVLTLGCIRSPSIAVDSTSGQIALVAYARRCVVNGWLAEVRLVTQSSSQGNPIVVSAGYPLLVSSGNVDLQAVAWTVRVAPIGQGRFMVTWVVTAPDNYTIPVGTPLLSAAVVGVGANGIEIINRTTMDPPDMFNMSSWMDPLAHPPPPLAMVPLAEDRLVLGTILPASLRPGRGTLYLLGLEINTIAPGQVRLEDPFVLQPTGVPQAMKEVGASSGEAEPKVRSSLTGIGFGPRAWFFWDGYAYQDPNIPTDPSNEHSEGLLVTGSLASPTWGVIGPVQQMEQERFAKPVVTRSMCCGEASIGMTFFDANEINWRSFKPVEQ